jgi:hypothetical protein
MEKGNFEFWDWLKRTGKLRRSFLKTSIAVDTDKKVILGWKRKHLHKSLESLKRNGD